METDTFFFILLNVILFEQIVISFWLRSIDKRLEDLRWRYNSEKAIQESLDLIYNASDPNSASASERNP